MIRRVLRYVSPKPWGSLSAIGHAKESNIQMILSFLRQPQGPMPQDVEFQSPMVWKQRPFTLGGEVLWTPATITNKGEVKFRIPNQSDVMEVWIAHRAPPSAWTAESLKVDMVPVLSQTKEEYATYLYDNRFLMKVDKAAWEAHGGKLLVVPASRWILPQVVCQRDGKEDEILGQYQSERKRTTGEMTWIGVPWIEVSCIRTLSML
jgi:tRNA(Ile)-lysidine synthase